MNFMAIKNFKQVLLANCMVIIAASSCTSSREKVQEKDNKIKLITLDPGHFHSALIQKSMYNEIDSVVHVYAPDGQELTSHLSLVESYNTRAENPTSWKENVYTGSDYLDKMIQDKAGNVVVIEKDGQRKGI